MCRLLLPVALLALAAPAAGQGYTPEEAVKRMKLPDGFTARLVGPCYRCLGDAVLEVPITAREYQAEKPEDEQMTTQYIAGGDLDVSQWARDAVALELPDKILCRPDCAGLCGVCGKKCMPQNAVAAACKVSKCDYTTCKPGFADCNGTPPDRTDGCRARIGGRG